MALFKKPLAGPGFIVLNTIRVMNIISLLAVIAASWVMLVKTFIISKSVTLIFPPLDLALTMVRFFFFDGASHLITSITGSKSPDWNYQISATDVRPRPKSS